MKPDKRECDIWLRQLIKVTDAIIQLKRFMGMGDGPHWTGRDLH